MSLSARLRHRIAIERRTESMDSEGNVTEVWAPLEIESSSSSTSSFALSSIPAEVLTGPGREGIAAAKVISETDARITLRWFPGLDYADRIVWDGNNYGIVEITTDATGRKEYRLRVVRSERNGA